MLGILQEVFPGKVVSKGGNTPWPPRSPNLTLPDFFLWSLLKVEVYREPVKSLRQLKRRIRDAVRAVPEAVIQDAVRGLGLRFGECVRNRGGHLENVIAHR